MRRTIKAYGFFLLIVLIISCEAIYEPKGLESGEKHLVINGFLTNEATTLRVNIKYAEAFGIEAYTSVNNAQVNLLLGNGEGYTVVSTGDNGDYRLSTQSFPVENNLTYSLQVITADGKEYLSDAQSFPEQVENITYTATIGQKEFDIENDAGEVVTYLKDGLFIDVSLESARNKTSYVRFDDIVVEQAHFIRYSPYNEYYTTDFNSFEAIPKIEKTLGYENKHTITHLDLGFLQYEYDIDAPGDIYKISNATPMITDSWVMMSYVYSINKETYKYYEKIINQLTSIDKVFDPTPSQITGNFTCISNPDEIVLGFWDVSTLSVHPVAYQWAAGDVDFQEKKLSNYALPERSYITQDTTRVSWVSF